MLGAFGNRCGRYVDSVWYKSIYIIRLGAFLWHHPCLPPHDVGVFFINHLHAINSKNSHLSKAVRGWSGFKISWVWTLCGHSEGKFITSLRLLVDLERQRSAGSQAQGAHRSLSAECSHAPESVAVQLCCPHSSWNGLRMYAAGCGLPDWEVYQVSLCVKFRKTSHNLPWTIWRWPPL